MLVLLSTMPLTVIIGANAQSNIEGQARIIIGQMLDLQRLPVMVVLNQGQPSEVALGTSKIIYDETVSDEFKCYFYDRNVGTNPFSVMENKNISMHVYCVEISQKNLFQYGDGQDFAQNSNWQKCYCDCPPPKNKELEITAFNALKEPNLRSIIIKPALSNTGLRERLMSKNSSNITG